MRVFSSALFSFCMIGYAMMITLSWQKFLVLQRNQYFVRKNLVFYEQTEQTSDAPDFFVCDIKACKLKIMCQQFQNSLQFLRNIEYLHSCRNQVHFKISQTIKNFIPSINKKQVYNSMTSFWLKKGKLYI